MAGRRVQCLLRFGALCALLPVLGCAAGEGNGGIGALLKQTADALSAGVVQDYDPVDYDGPPLGSLPLYRTGDVYTYSTGRTETISGVGGQRVIWENDREAIFERYRNFVLPTIRIETARGIVERSFDVPPDLLWPLIPGTRRHFTSEVRVRMRGERAEQLFRREWICTVNGKERVTVQFGEFDSVKISCDRYGRGRWRQKRVWYYVPEVGHYVRRTDDAPGRDKNEVELVSIQQDVDVLSRRSRRALHDLEQETLERTPSGETKHWRSPDGSVSVSMTVTKTLKTEAGQFCRTFRQEISSDGSARLLPGLACRTWNGRWVRL